MISDLQNLLNLITKLDWCCDIDDEKIFEISQKNFTSLVKDNTKNKNYYRTIGQSGSGKTTQLLPAIKSLCMKKGDNPIHFAIRRFVSWHPQYEELLKQHGKENIRETTNGFALRCMLFSVYFAVEQGYDIIIEVTLLIKEFEKYILSILKQHNYNRFYYGLAINKEISDYFINIRRQKKDALESGRNVNESSLRFFYNVLEPSLTYLSEEDGDCEIVIWDAYSLDPIYDGKISQCINKFIDYRQLIKYDFNDIDELKNSKISYLIKKLN